MPKFKQATKIVNCNDLSSYAAGNIAKANLRQVTISLFVDEVDPYLFLPTDIIEELGLQVVLEGNAISKGTIVFRKIFEPVFIAKWKRNVFVIPLPLGYPPTMGSDLFSETDLRGLLDWNSGFLQEQVQATNSFARASIAS